MKTESLGGFDRFRVPAALLVIAIHTGPLLSLNGEANYLLTDILARIAVPFFFSVSGWFLVPRLLREGRAALIPFVKKLLLLYGAAVLLYLPLNLYNHTLEESGFALLRDVLFNGTFYHLWYFPALVLGASAKAEARPSLSDSHVRRGKARQMQERALEQRTKSTAIHRRPGKMVRPI